MPTARSYAAPLKTWGEDGERPLYWLCTMKVVWAPAIIASQG